MRLGEMSAARMRRQLRAEGIRLRIGPFSVSVISDQARFWSAFHFLYGDFPLLPDIDPVDFRIRLTYPMGLRRWIRPEVLFHFDTARPFEPFPAALAMPFFEWGLNWCIYEHAHEFLILHASVVERGGKALVMPGPPGAGKSTLCAALVHSGWRLLSDEFALVGKDDGCISPLPRPIGLKEESIPAIRIFAPSVALGPIFRGTQKGDVAHMRPPFDAVMRANETALPAWLVFPQYEPMGDNRLQRITKAAAFISVFENSFNYRVLGEIGFDSLTAFTERCSCYSLTFGDLSLAIGALEKLVAGPNDVH